MEYKSGYVYHINDSYFEKVKDDKLMKNKENGNFRPTFYCLKDSKTSLLWVVPLSSQVDKYQKIVDKQIQKYGKSLGIYIDIFDGKSNAFLLQNMFPITEKYLHHIHTRNGNPVPVKPAIQQEIKDRIQKIRNMTAHGRKVVFPDIMRLEQLMLEELKQSVLENESLSGKNVPFKEQVQSMEQWADNIAERATEQKQNDIEHNSGER